MRKQLIAANWKMNKTVKQAAAFAQAFRPKVEGANQVDIAVFPPFTGIQTLVEAFEGSSIAVGGQNCYMEESGAYTGEVSPQMLAEAGCAWVILGHSERRQIFGETDAYLNAKLRFTLGTPLNVIFCIGETLEERENGDMDGVLRRQLAEGLDEVTAASLERVVIAYEPVWAIGTGRTATPDQAEEAQAFVRGLLASQYNESVAQQMRILYGGSVKPDNARDLLTQDNVDGALVGGASLEPDSFAAIVQAGQG